MGEALRYDRIQLISLANQTTIQNLIESGENSRTAFESNAFRNDSSSPDRRPSNQPRDEADADQQHHARHDPLHRV